MKGLKECSNIRAKQRREDVSVTRSFRILDVLVPTYDES